jgi:hypothetical protein
MTTNHEDESFTKYTFWLSGEPCNIFFHVKPSTIKAVVFERYDSAPDWGWFETKEGLVCIDFSKVIAIYPDNS